MHMRRSMSMSVPPEQRPDTALEEAIYPVPPQNKNTAPFHVLATLFDRLSTERKQDKRRKLLQGWFNHWREQCGLDLYPVIRLILPQKDRERTMYGLKEKALAKAYIKLIPLQMKDPDAIRLLNWKRPAEKERTSGDFPGVLYEVIGKRSSVMEGTLTIQELNDLLDELSKSDKKLDAQSHILQRIYDHTTPEEQRWIVRIILRDMTISVKETTVFAVFHPDAHDLFNTCSDLKKVVWELGDPERRLNDQERAIQLFHAFAPMLCKRPSHKVEDMVKELNAPLFIIEEKLDGERMQLHKRGNEYYYCSRKGKDYTYLYGKHIGVGSLTPYLDGAFDDRVDDIILDGEMLVWDPISQRNLPFGTLKTAALDRSKKEHNPRPCFKVFDLLYLNGMSLINKSTKFRKRNLRACVKEIRGRIEYIIEYEGRTAKDIRQRMEDIMDNRGEGLILKHPNAEYVLNGRNKDWLKVKPEYMDNMGETVDVLVVGGNFGTGRRSGGVSSLICAVLDDRRNILEDDELKYRTFVRVGSGFSFSDYAEIRSRPWKEYPVGRRPSFIIGADKGGDDRGDMYLEPEHSFLISVKAAEITGSLGYGMGFTMRFPRCVGVRLDLSIEDCMKASEVIDAVKAMKKRKNEEQQNGGLNKKTKVSKRKGPAASVPSEYKGLKVSLEEIESSLLEGLKFAVISDPKSKTGKQDREQLLRLVLVHGARIANVPTGGDLVIYGGSTTPYDLKMLINKDSHDILKPNWLHECISREELVAMRPRHFFHATVARQADEDFLAGDDADEELPPLEDPPAPLTPKQPNVKDEPADAVSAPWFPPAALSKQAVNDGDSDTEDDSVLDPESDNDDTNEREKEWEQVPESNALDSDFEVVEAEEPEPADEDNQPPAEAAPTMGETEDAMEYDTELIFKHLCFYLDSPENARKMGMSVKATNEAKVSNNFREMEKLITENGGRIGGLDDPKLTHILLDKRDVSRRKELSSRTSKPKRRYLVLTDFITGCLAEETLLDEPAFAP